MKLMANCLYASFQEKKMIRLGSIDKLLLYSNQGWCDDKSHQVLIYRLTKWSRPKCSVGAENSLGMFELPLNKEHSELIYFLKCHRTEKLPPTLSARYALDWR